MQTCVAGEMEDVPRPQGEIDIIEAKKEHNRERMREYYDRRGRALKRQKKNNSKRVQFDATADASDDECQQISADDAETDADHGVQSADSATCFSATEVAALKSLISKPQQQSKLLEIILCSMGGLGILKQFATAENLKIAKSFLERYLRQLQTNLQTTQNPASGGVSPELQYVDSAQESALIFSQSALPCDSVCEENVELEENVSN